MYPIIVQKIAPPQQLFSLISRDTAEKLYNNNIKFRFFFIKTYLMRR